MAKPKVTIGIDRRVPLNEYTVWAKFEAPPQEWRRSLHLTQEMAQREADDIRDLLDVAGFNVFEQPMAVLPAITEEIKAKAKKAYQKQCRSENWIRDHDKWEALSGSTQEEWYKHVLQLR